MKKILSLLLCLVLVSGMLISCGNDFEPGAYLPNYDYEEDVVEDLTLNICLITEAETTANAKSTVSQMVNQHTETQYHTTVNITYYTAAEYAKSIKDAVSDNSENGANIVLITSDSMLNDLVGLGKIAILNQYYQSDKFGTLNVQIPEALLDASYLGDNIVTVPNNRIIGEYEYLVINKEVAIQKNYGIPSEVGAYTSLEDAKALMETMTKNGYRASDYVYTVKGDYALKATLEAQGNYCNVMTYPTVTSAFAFSSAFAIVNRDEAHNERAMEIIYAINTDTYLRNLLQYGVKGTNYTVSDDGDIIRVKEGDNVYYMNPAYTGDMFKLNYCSEIGWDKTVATNGALQNDQSVSYRAEKDK